MSQLAQRLIMASGGKKDSTYVEDVFSTYLYKGDGTITGDIQPVNNGIKLGNSNVGNSVSFDGTGDYISIPNSTAWDIGTNYTAECFFNIDRIVGNGWDAIFGQWPGSNNAATNTWVLEYVGASTLYFYYVDSSQTMQNVSLGNVSRAAWHHFAFSKEGSNTRLFIDGNLTQTITPAYWDGTGSFNIGGNVASGGWINGSVSNVRITKDQALYTSNFTPTTAELTTTSQGATESNVKLLCCQSSTSTTAATVTPGTITQGGNPRSSGFGPFQTGEDAKGGMVWMKSRDNSYWHSVVDTVRGANKTVYPNSPWQEETLTNLLNSFNNSGFTAAYNSSYSGVFTNKNHDNYASWTFAIQEGFFDIQTWDGNNTAGRQLPHNLGSVPGCIMVKSTNNSGDWMVYHREIGATHRLKLNSNTNSSTTASWNDVVPTSTYVELGSNTGVNASGTSYVGYFFAGGASDESGSARSIEFDGSGDYLKLGASSDFAFGTGDFTIECWVDFTDTSTDGGQNRRIFALDDQGNAADNFQINIDNGYRVNGSLYFWSNSLQGYLDTDIRGSWHHIAVARQSGTLRIFLDGSEKYSASNTQDYSPNGGSPRPVIGAKGNDGGNLGNLNGSISNMRVVVGTAVYTSSFRPPTKGLTNITNTKLLCCNKNTVTGSTVTSSTITSYGNPQSSIYTPFDDPEGFQFGGEGDQNIIKTGSYIGNANNDGPEVYVGWEPQYILFKPTTGSEHWGLFDSMRGIVTGGIDMRFLPDDDNEEITNFDGFSLTPTGFKITTLNALINPSNAKVVYMAIRRSDGYVGKPAEVGIDVFNMAYGTSDSTIPKYPSGFVTDLTINRQPASSISWRIQQRLTGTNRMYTDTTAAESTNSNVTWDFMYGSNKSTSNASTWLAWHWKRGAGFDVVTYAGVPSTYSASGVGSINVPHSLKAVPEMIWVKNRTYDDANGWAVYHVGLNGGTNPEQYRIRLQATNAEDDNVGAWQDTAPTSTHFTLGTDRMVNQATFNYVAMLFTSVDGISKCGYYDGSDTTQTITTGFQPRFVILKRTNTTGSWFVLDTTRGWGAGNDEFLLLNSDAAQDGNYNLGEPTATGFTLTGNDSYNNAGDKFIYYAHA